MSHTPTPTSKPNWTTPALIGTILACSALDAGATLALMGRGYGEANPLMQPLVALGPVAFLLGKQTITAASLGLLWWVRNRPLVRRVLVGLVLAYGVLLAYEAVLLTAW